MIYVDVFLILIKHFENEKEVKLQSNEFPRLDYINNSGFN